MSYDLRPVNEEAGVFQFGGFSWAVVVQSWGFLFPYQTRDGKYFAVEMDEDRQIKVWNEETDDGWIEDTTRLPLVDSNDGFMVNADECPFIARCARNLAAWQRAVNTNEEVLKEVAEYEKPEYVRLGMKAWPKPMREDWIEKFEAFADWVERSGGFAIH